MIRPSHSSFRPRLSKSIRIGLLSGSLFGSLLAVPAFAFAPVQTTAFTYQGHLKDTGAPANGLYDFTFTLYDASSLAA